DESGGHDYGHSLAAVIDGLEDKLIRRHPLAFDDGDEPASLEDVEREYRRIKAEEKERTAARGKGGGRGVWRVSGSRALSIAVTSEGFAPGPGSPRCAPCTCSAATAWHSGPTGPVPTSVPSASAPSSTSGTSARGRSFPMRSTDWRS